MSKYIDATDIAKQIADFKRVVNSPNSDYMTGYICALSVTEGMIASTADVVEVRHGEWIYHECVSSYDGCKSGYSCSVCNAFVDEQIFDTDEFHKVFCGNCGAKMDGGRGKNGESI